MLCKCQDRKQAVGGKNQPFYNSINPNAQGTPWPSYREKSVGARVVDALKSRVRDW